VIHWLLVDCVVLTVTTLRTCIEMRSFTPEISWHNREPVFSVDVQSNIQSDSNDPQSSFYRVASAGGDNCVVIWRAYVKAPSNDPKPIDEPMADSCRKSADHKNLIDLDVVASLNLHIKSVNCAKFAPQSNMLASGGDDSYVYVWMLDQSINR
jgi:chromatin assembly factor 1 subunit B